MGVSVRTFLPAVLVIAAGATWVAPAAQSHAPYAGAARPPATLARTTSCPSPSGPTSPTTGPVSPPGTGRVGTGTVLGALPDGVNAPVGPAVVGRISTAVANIPSRTSDSGFVKSMQMLRATRPDFMVLNEITRHSDAAIKAQAPGFGFYRDPSVVRGADSAWLSMENAVLWRSDRWHLLDGGRVKTVNDDHLYMQRRRYNWDRFVIWTTLQRSDGAVVSVIAAHQTLNAVRAPRQWGSPPPPLTRTQIFARSMQIVVALVHRLEQYGPVLLAGDMNSHPGEGSWTTAAYMTGAGYGYTKDRGVMYQFYPPGVGVVSSHELGIVSDHPALATTLEMNGVGATAPASGSSGSARRTTGAPTLPSGAALSDAQVQNARVIAARAAAARLPREAVVDALAAALTASNLQNLPAKNGAVGILGQRPRDGWGTQGQLASPAYAADAFFGTATTSKAKGLTDYPWRTLTVPEIDGAVLGTPFPEKYAARADDAAFLAAYLANGTTTCSSGLGSCPPATDVSVNGSVAPGAEAVLRCVHQAFPSLRRYVGNGPGRYCDGDRLVSGLDIPLAAAGADPTTKAAQARGARAAHYLQVHASELGVNFLVFGGRSWDADEQEAGWRPYAATDGARTAAALVKDRIYVAVKGGSC